MRLKYIFLSILLVVFIFVLIFFLRGLSYPAPLGLNLSISENISPNVNVFVLDQFGKTITAIEVNDDFFPQQKGLEEGTVYGFRVIDDKMEVSMPVYETFIANGPDWTGWEIGKRYYHGLRPSNYTVELLIIENNTGIIIARTNLSSFNLYEQRAEIEKKIMDNCSYLMNEPLVDVDGWSREGKIGKCAANVGVEIENIYACDILFKLFNDSGVGFGECVLDYAIIIGNTSICDHAGMPKSRGFCKAKVTKDWTECRKVSCDISCKIESLETQQDFCILWYATENRNVSLCEEIKTEAYNMKESCLKITAEK
jgi:hypothetical protein